MISHRGEIVDYCLATMAKTIDFNKMYKMTLGSALQLLIKVSKVKRINVPRCIAEDVGDYLNRHIWKLSEAPHYD